MNEVLFKMVYIYSIAATHNMLALSSLGSQLSLAAAAAISLLPVVTYSLSFCGDIFHLVSGVYKHLLYCIYILSHVGCNSRQLVLVTTLARKLLVV